VCKGRLIRAGLEFRTLLPVMLFLFAKKLFAYFYISTDMWTFTWIYVCALSIYGNVFLGGCHL
jgi:hypothetical protein